MIRSRRVIRTRLFRTIRSVVRANRHFNVRVLHHEFLTVIENNPTIRRYKTQIGRGRRKGDAVLIHRFRRTLSRHLVARIRTVGYTRYRRNLLIIARQKPFGQTFNIENRIHSVRRYTIPFVHAVLFIRCEHYYTQPMSDYAFRHICFAQEKVQ